MKTLRVALMIVLLASLALMFAGRNLTSVLAASLPSVALNAANAAPRTVEDSTRSAVERDYAAAWRAMADALGQNRTDLLNANFIGSANDLLTATIKQQRQSGLHQQLVDKGHTVDVVFYSPEGSAMELHDTVRLERQLLDGSKVVHSEDATAHYVVLLTAAENSWNVRVMEEVPSF